MRQVALLAAATAIGSTGLAAGGTADALVAADLAGTDAAAGLPLGLLVLGSAAAAVLVSRLTPRIGRRSGLAAGYLAGSAGAAAVVASAAAGCFAGVLAGSTLLGAANAAIFLTRYAAAELVAEAARGRALGLVLFSTSIGAVAGPLLLGPSGRLAEAVALPRLTGLYLVATPAFLLAALLLRVREASVRSLAPPGEAVRGLLTRSASAVGALAVANLVMVAVMAVAPLNLHEHGRGLEAIGTMISFHVAGMFAPSPLSGWLADRAGPHSAIVAGSLLIVLAGLGGAVAPPGDMLETTVVLALLGVGWNASIVGASAAIAHSGSRLRAEAVGEVAMGVAAAAAAPAAGLVVAVGGFPTLSLSGAAIAAGSAAIYGLGRGPKPA
jgi:MFS family permease